MQPPAVGKQYATTFSQVVWPPLDLIEGENLGGFHAKSICRMGRGKGHE